MNVRKLYIVLDYIETTITNADTCPVLDLKSVIHNVLLRINFAHITRAPNGLSVRPYSGIKSKIQRTQLFTKLCIFQLRVNLEWIALLNWTSLNCKLKCVAIPVGSETSRYESMFSVLGKLSWSVDSRFHSFGPSKLERLPTLSYKQACLHETHELEFENVQVSTLEHILKVPLPALQIDYQEPSWLANTHKFKTLNLIY